MRVEAAWNEVAMPFSIPRNATEETMLYRFACLDAHDNAVSTEEIEARSLIDALAKAHMMLRSPRHGRPEPLPTFCFAGRRTGLPQPASAVARTAPVPHAE